MLCGRWNTRRRRRDRWNSQPQLRTVVTSITWSPVDGNMLLITLGDASTLHASPIYLRDSFAFEQLLDEHELVADVDVPGVRGMLAALGIDIEEWADDEEIAGRWQ